MTVIYIVISYAAVLLIGILVGVRHTEDSICYTIKRLGYRTIDNHTRIVGYIEKGNFE